MENIPWHRELVTNYVNFNQKIWCNNRKAASLTKKLNFPSFYRFWRCLSSRKSFVRGHEREVPSGVFFLLLFKHHSNCHHHFHCLTTTTIDGHWSKIIRIFSPLNKHEKTSFCPLFVRFAFTSNTCCCRFLASQWQTCDNNGQKIHKIFCMKSLNVLDGHERLEFFIFQIRRIFKNKQQNCFF